LCIISYMLACASAALTEIFTERRDHGNRKIKVFMKVVKIKSM